MSGPLQAVEDQVEVTGVIDYTRADLTDGRRRWDVIVDTAGRHHGVNR